ncbi:MAG: LptA/OstA family protein [Alphaproteobacteria bacterium]|nr:LptA/OstA family protein [Alphaproteobacteria bacterium]
MIRAYTTRFFYIAPVILWILGLTFRPVFAQGAADLNFSHDSSQPIEITADSLDVAQADQTAIFSGNVVSIQGELRLGSDNLRVYYRGGDVRTSGQGAISRLDAIGAVAVSSPRETATSEWAVYDVDSGQITLGGKVVLTRGQNVLRGEQLVIDLESGQSRIIGAPSSGGRVKGLFVPAKKPQ